MCKSLQKLLTKKLNNNINNWESFKSKSKHKLSWKPLNEMSKRKGTKSGNVKRKTKEERVKGRHTNIKELLGNPSVLAYQDDNISFERNNKICISPEFLTKYMTEEIRLKSAIRNDI